MFRTPDLDWGGGAWRVVSGASPGNTNSLQPVTVTLRRGAEATPDPCTTLVLYSIKSDNKSLVNEILRSTREKIGNGGVRFVWLWLTHFSRLRLSVLLLPQWCQVQFRQNWYHYQDTVSTTNPALSFMKRYTKIGLHNNLETYLYNTLLKGGKLEHWSF